MKSLKKFFSVLFAVLTAAMLSISFTACGGDNSPSDGDGSTDNNNNTQTIAVAEKTVKALTELYTADGFEGTVKVGFGSDMYSGENAVANEYSVVKSSDRAQVNGTKRDGSPFAATVDLKTGYLYLPSENGYIFKQAMPAYSLDYALYVIERETAAADTDEIDKKLSYDADTKTVAYSADKAEELNAYLAPLYDDRYTKVEHVVDAYVAMLTAKAAAADESGKTQAFDTFDELFEDLTDELKVWKDFKLGFLFDMVNESGKTDVYAELKKFGITFDAEQKNAINSRTVEQAIVAVSKFIDDTVTDIVSGITGAPSGSLAAAAEYSNSAEYIRNILAMLNGFKATGKQFIGKLLNAALFAPTDDGATYDQAIANIKGNIDIFLALNKSAVVSAIGAKSPELAFIIQNKVEFTALEYGFALTFDDEYRTSRIVFNGRIAHNYSGADESDVKLLADNNYVFGAEISVSEYTDGAQISETPLAPDQRAKNVRALVFGDMTQDVEIYIESSAALAVTDISAAFGYEAGEEDTVIELNDGDIVYDGESKTLTVKSALSRSQFTDEIAGAEIKIKLYTDAENYIEVILMRLSDDRSDILTVLENMLAKYAAQ